MSQAILSTLKDVRNYTRTIEATGNIVAYTRYDEPAAGRSSFITTTYRPPVEVEVQKGVDEHGNPVMVKEMQDLPPITTYRQGPLGSDELPTVSEFQFENFEAYEAARNAKTRGQSLAEAHRPNFAKKPAGL